MTTPAGPFVGLLLLSHGPLANALRETVHMLEPDEPDDLGALSLAWDESPESASRRLEKAISEVNRGKGRRPPDGHVRRHAVEPRARVPRARE